MLNEFRKVQSAIQTVRNINEVYGPDAVKVRAIQYWFSKFLKGNFNLEDVERFGRHPVLNSDDLKTVVSVDIFQSCQDIEQTMNSSTSTVFRHLKEIGKISKCGKWVPHQLSEKQQIERVNIATSLLLRTVL